jgi:hypothetical protein
MTTTPDLFHPSTVTCAYSQLRAKCAELKAAGAHIQTMIVKPGEYELHLL